MVCQALTFKATSLYLMIFFALMAELADAHG